MRPSRPILSKTYDYVVVGGGSAGCVLASRLSDDPSVSVALVEAGPPNESRFIHMPLGVGMLLPSWGKDGWLYPTLQKLNWAFDAEPEPLLNGRRPYQPRGRTLGGSSSINAMVYVRGSKHDYDKWEALGNRGWGWSECVKAFRSVEDGIGETEGDRNPLHLAVARGAEARLGRDETFPRMFMTNAAKSLDIPFNPDYNETGDIVGVMAWDRTAHSGRRRSASDAFINPLMGQRKNLTVLTNRHCTKVDLDTSGAKPRATGIRCVPVSDRGSAKSSNEEVISAGKVILSMGALQTPQVMMLSGLGPKEELSAHGIRPVLEMPGVGRRLLDHADIGVLRTVDTSKGVHDTTVVPSRIPGVLKELLTFDMNDPEARLKNMFGNLHTECGYFSQTPTAKAAKEQAPDIQAHFCAAIVKDHTRQPATKPGITGLVCLLNPKSEGYVGLRNASPLSPPKIVMNYMTHEEDRTRMTEGIRQLVGVLAEKGFAEITTGTDGTLTAEDAQSDEKVWQYIQRAVDTIYHPVSTCRMGDDDTAVVSDRLAVHGVDNLNIADASVFPYITSGNTNSPSMMVGERMSRFIKAGEA